MEESKRKNEKLVTTIVVLLMIIILLLFWFVRCLGFIEHKHLEPTGNVDIFDINFGVDCNKKGSGEDDGTLSVFEEKVGGLTVNDDDDVYYSEITKLNIFTKTAYVADGRIAPGSENSYQFVIRNNSNFDIKYHIDMIESNEYGVNMMYRLKLNNSYVAGSANHYVTAEELAQKDIKIMSQRYNTYTLEWKWVESDNETDTAIGTRIDANYQLDIKISAMEY